MRKELETAAAYLHDYKRHILRLVIPYVKIEDEGKQMEWTRILGASFDCLSPEETREAVYFAEQLLEKLGIDI